jgi:RimJ/RimL family protein N-acetyltransferase
MRTTERLVLRPAHIDDLKSLFLIYSDPATNTFNPAGPLTTHEAARAVLKRWMHTWNTEGFGQWAIATAEQPDRIIGFGGLSRYMHGDIDRVNLGYRFAVPAWRKGYATELALTALRFGFDERAFDEIYGVVRPTHAASIRVLEKAGMQRVGTLHDVLRDAPSLVYRALKSQR